MRDDYAALLVSPRLVEQTYPGKPMALDYLAAALQQEGWHVEIIDVGVEGEDQYRRWLTTRRFALVGLTAMSIQVDQSTRLAQLAREISPGSILIRGGAHDTYAYVESCLTHRTLYDALVVGEGEETIREIARSVATGRFGERREKIRGLAYWDGKPIFTGFREPLDVNQYVPRRLHHHPTYDFDVFHFRKTAQVLGARGCANACFYCSESVSGHGRTEHRRSIESLRQEFAILKSTGYRAIYFDDPTFTRDRKWVLALCDEIRQWGFVWGCNTRVDQLDELLVKTMRDAGCVYLFCGLESAVPEVLFAMNKTHRPGEYLESAQRAYAAMRSHGLPCSVFLIFGCPRREWVDGHLHYSPDSEADWRASLDFAINYLNPDYLSLNILRFLPGVPLSFAPQFACIRPTGKFPIHGGYYDSIWYKQQGCPDLRSAHPIFRAFEGCFSVNPVHMSPERCYQALALAVEMLNRKNAQAGSVQTRIVVDPRFKRFLQEGQVNGSRQYRLAPFEEIIPEPSDPANGKYVKPGEAVLIH